jgi:hypothetical protein
VPNPRPPSCGAASAADILEHPLAGEARGRVARAGRPGASPSRRRGRGGGSFDRTRQRRTDHRPASSGSVGGSAPSNANSVFVVMQGGRDHRHHWIVETAHDSVRAGSPGGAR